MYGGFVVMDYLRENESGPVILLEPYLGLRSLNTPFRQLARMGHAIGKRSGYQLPVGKRHHGKGTVNIGSFTRYMLRDLELPKRDVEMIGVRTGYAKCLHKFFFDGYFESVVERYGGSMIDVSDRAIKLTGLYKAVIDISNK
jgi:hypothetical protein